MRNPRIVGGYLIFGPAVRKQPDDEIDGHPGSSDDWLAAQDFGIDDNTLRIHGSILGHKSTCVKRDLTPAFRIALPCANPPS